MTDCFYRRPDVIIGSFSVLPHRRARPASSTARVRAKSRSVPWGMRAGWGVEDLRATDITRAVLAESTALRPRLGATLMAALRSFLRFVDAKDWSPLTCPPCSRLPEVEPRVGFQAHLGASAAPGSSPTSTPRAPRPSQLS